MKETGARNNAELYVNFLLEIDLSSRVSYHSPLDEWPGA
jgi:hypothetical protein